MSALATNQAEDEVGKLAVLVASCSAITLVCSDQIESLELTLNSAKLTRRRLNLAWIHFHPTLKRTDLFT